MPEIKKIPPQVWSPEITLQSLWQKWMSLNGILRKEQANSLLSRAGIRHGDGLSSWLNNEPTISLLTMAREQLTEVTGIDIDGWMVCEAKRRLIAAEPGITDRVSFTELTSRQSILEEINDWKKRYGGTTLHLALQIGVKPSSLNGWTNGTRLIPFDQIGKILRALIAGFIPYTSYDDTTFALMCRSLIGCQSHEVFDGVSGFKEVIDLLFAPYKKYTLTRTASEVEINEGSLRTLQEWQPKQGKGFPPTSIEKVLRTLVKRFWPSLIGIFDEGVVEYRVKEDEGIWACKQPLLPLIQALSVDEPTIDTTRRIVPSEIEEIEEEKPTPSQTTAEDVLADLLEFAAGKLRTLGVERLNQSTPTVNNPHTREEQIGATINDIKYCLDRTAFTPRPELRLTHDQLTAAGSAIDGTRALIVMLCELDPSYIRKEIRPLLGQRFYELMIGTEGLRHLLHSREAWNMIEGMRLGTEVISKATGQNNVGGK